MSVIFNDGSKVFYLDPKTNMTVTINSGSVYQTTPGSISLTGTTLNARGAVSWNWTAKTSAGASASSFITGSGQNIVFTPSLPDQKFHIILTASDSVGQNAYANVAVSVSGALALIPPADTSDTLPLGSTTASFTFATASGGWSNISYALTSFGTGSITTPLNVRSGTLSYLGDGSTSKVKITYTDGAGQTATSSHVYGVGTDPVFDENAVWNLVQEVNFTTLPTGSWSAGGTYTVGDISLKITANNSPAFTTAIGSSGMITYFSGVAGTTSNVALEFEFDGGITNYAPGENILVDVVWSVDEILNTDLSFLATIGDGTGNVSSGDNFGMRVYADTLVSHTLASRRYQSATAFTTNVTSANFIGTSFATQILMVGQRVALISNDVGTDYLGGPKLGLSIPMRGQWTVCPSGTGLSPAESLTSAFSTIRFISMLSASVAGARRGKMTVKKVKMSRLTRPPAT
jgi:hypothetical protein